MCDNDYNFKLDINAQQMKSKCTKAKLRLMNRCVAFILDEKQKNQVSK